jgi:histidinol phosphatase-like enzyme
MMVACKYEEIYPPEITDFVYICADTYTKKQIIDMEKRLLMALCHDLNKPTQLEFLRRYSKITMTNSREHAMAKYLLEQGLLECNLSRERPSVKAAAAVILAKSIIQHKMISCNILKAYTGYSEGNLQEMAVRLKECMICYHHNHKFTAVKKKYETIQYLEIANSRELRKISQL